MQLRLCAHADTHRQRMTIQRYVDDNWSTPKQMTKMNLRCQKYNIFITWRRDNTDQSINQLVIIISDLQSSINQSVSQLISQLWSLQLNWINNLGFLKIHINNKGIIIVIIIIIIIVIIGIIISSKKLNKYVYIYIHTHTDTHTHTYIYIYVNII
jgi:hypothetical protein